MNAVQNIENDQYLKAAACYLGFNSECPAALSEIELQELEQGVHAFSHDNCDYVIAHTSHGLVNSHVVSFQSMLSVQMVKSKFSDDQLLAHLSTKMPTGYSLLTVRQSEYKALLKNTSGQLVCFSYTSHFPDELSTYYFKGNTTEPQVEMHRMFGDYLNIYDK
jgi:hypothetical protein